MACVYAKKVVILRQILDGEGLGRLDELDELVKLVELVELDEPGTI